MREADATHIGSQRGRAAGVHVHKVILVRQEVGAPVEGGPNLYQRADAFRRLRRPRPRHRDN
eukprot:6511978-Prymnesium_polylepis.1